MSGIQFATFVLLSVCVLVQVTADGCTFEVCFCDGTQIMCEDRGFTEIPSITGTTPDNAYLMIDSNKITTVPDGRLPKNLIHFSMFNNPIQTVDDAAFDDSASTLQTVQFSNCRFTRIPDAFLHLNNLKYLTIFETIILDWNEDVMKHIGPTILTLDLQNVGLTAWPSWFHYFSNVTELSLDGGSISSIPDDALDMLADSLTTLSIGNNSLTSIPKTISKLKVLQSLQVHNNTISNITWLPHLSKLGSLWLNNNCIFDATDLSNSLRPFADSLYDINLLGNLLTEIPDLSFLAMVDGLDFTYNRISNPYVGSLSNHLDGLNLGNNDLTKIPVILKQLPNVIELLLSSNAITEIQDRDFSPWITVVDLSFNLITELTDTSFPQNSSITILNLMNNPLATISAHVFDNLQLLSVLNLRNSKLTRLPVGLALLSNINYFDVNGSSDLVCTCMEKSLAPWILRIPNNPGGYCGQATIHDFFATLSEDCS